MTIEIKCANCLTTVRRACGTDEETTAPWLCPDCDPDEGAVAVEDEGFGSEKQLREADAFNDESTNIHYIGYLKAKGLLGDHFPDDEPAEKVLDGPGGWFADDSIVGKPTRAQRKKTEKRLAKHGLAANQLRSQQDVQAVVKPVLEGSEFQGDIQDHQFDRRLDRKSWHSDARRRAHGSELNGHHALKRREHIRLIPTWTLNDGQVREVLWKVFPKHDTSARQRESAGRWLRIIYLYFRANQWAKTIAEAVGCSVRAVESVICRARKVGAEMFGSASSAVDTFEDTGKTTSTEVAIQPIGNKADQAHHASMDNSHKKQAA